MLDPPPRPAPEHLWCPALTVCTSLASTVSGQVRSGATGLRGTRTPRLPREAGPEVQVARRAPGPPPPGQPAAPGRRHGGSARPINNPEGAALRQRGRCRPGFPRPPGPRRPARGERSWVCTAARPEGGSTCGPVALGIVRRDSCSSQQRIVATSGSAVGAGIGASPLNRYPAH